MTIGRVVIIKKLYAYITGKSVKQRICICIVAAAVITLLAFTIKANFIDKPLDNFPQAEITENIGTSEGESTESVSAENELPQLRISLIDVGVLLAVVTAYGIHKFREKRKQRRL